MRPLHLTVLALAALAPLPSSAQRRPQDLSDSDSLRALVKTVPLLDM